LCNVNHVTLQSDHAKSAVKRLQVLLQLVSGGLLSQHV
jgi:hypothetical protein